MVKTSAVTKGILWQGKSLIDGSDIVVIALGHSGNSKTGDMVQTYILQADIAPIEASRTGADIGVCGTCKHRGMANPEKSAGWADNRTCYVNLLHGPTIIYKGYKAGKYPQLSAEQIRAIGKNRMIRLGTYGDPQAVPASVFADLLSLSVGSTGYTHQPLTGETMPQLMASADSMADAENAWKNSRRTFRVIPVADWENKGKQALHKTEILCPASVEAGKRSTCEKCSLCDATKRGKNIAIVAHGSARKKVK